MVIESYQSCVTAFTIVQIKLSFCFDFHPPFLDLCHIAQEILSQRITKNCKEMIKPARGEEAEVEELVPESGTARAWSTSQSGPNQMASRFTAQIFGRSFSRSHFIVYIKIKKNIYKYISIFLHLVDFMVNVRR